MLARNLPLLALGGLLLTLGSAQADGVAYHQLDERAKLAWVGQAGSEDIPRRGSLVASLRSSYRPVDPGHPREIFPWAYAHFFEGLASCARVRDCQAFVEQGGVSAVEAERLELARQASNQVRADMQGLIDLGRQVFVRDWSAFQVGQTVGDANWDQRTWAQFLESGRAGGAGANTLRMVHGLYHPQFEGKYDASTHGEPADFDGSDIAGIWDGVTPFVTGTTGFGGDYDIAPEAVASAGGLFGLSDTGDLTVNDVPATTDAVVAAAVPSTLVTPDVDTAPVITTDPDTGATVLVPPTVTGDNDASSTDTGWETITIEQNMTLGDLGVRIRNGLPRDVRPPLWGADGVVDLLYQANAGHIDDPNVLRIGDQVRVPTEAWFTI